MSWVIASFRDKGTEDLFDGRDTKQARKSCPSDLVRVARINDQWRVCFRWTESDAEDVEIVDYH